jgi:HK97 family phage major capsid protein
MEAKIIEWLKAGKSADEIDLLVSKEFENVTAEEYSAALQVAKKAVEARKGRKDADAARTASADMQKKVDEMVDAKLKSINIDPSRKFVVSGQKMKTRESIAEKGQHVEMNPEQSEAYQLYEKQLRAIIGHDTANAKAISKDLDAYNLKAAGDPVRSDSDAVGGYAIPTEVDSEIRLLERKESVMLQTAMTDVIIVENKIYPVGYSVACVDITNQATDITEDLLAMAGPTVAMERFGAFMNVSNTIVRQRADIAPTVTRLFATARAKFLDYRLSCGNVTGASQLVDGIIFDTATSAQTAITKANWVLSDIQNLINVLNAQANGKLLLMGNRKVMGLIGLLKDTAGSYIFQNYVSGGSPLAPLGVPFILNTEITSVLDIGGDNNTGGTDDALICADFSKFIVGVDGGARIESTDAYDFVGDNTTMKIVGRYGAKVIMATGDAGIVSAVQEIN